MDRILASTPMNVFEQMALDEVLVQSYEGGFLLRFYSWTDGPACTFGYAQFYQEVQRQLANGGFKGPAVRRPTGGGIVLHEDDLTFSCVFKTTQTSPKTIYQHLHGQINDALQQAGLMCTSFNQPLTPSDYAPSVDHQASACFMRPVENDLLSDGKKVLGGAIRRFADTILYQGSLQCAGARKNPAYKRAVIEAVQSGYGVQLKPQAVSKALSDAARQLAQTQYMKPEWNQKF